MIRRDGDYGIDVRRGMRGGDGEVRIEHLWLPGGDLKAKTRLFARLTLPPGASIGFHRHDNEEEVFYIVSGRALMNDDGVESELCPGDTILTGGGAGHAVESVGGEPLVMLAVINEYACLDD